MTQEDYINLPSIIESEDKELNAVESLIEIMRSPIAKRKGVNISPEDCKIWVEELENYLKEK